MQIQIGSLLQKPTDLDLHCSQRQDISGFSKKRVNIVKPVWRGQDTLARFFYKGLGVGVWLPACFPFWKGICSKWKQFAPRGSKFFPFRIDHFAERRQNNFDLVSTSECVPVSHKTSKGMLHLIWVYTVCLGCIVSPILRVDTVFKEQFDQDLHWLLFHLYF